MKQKLFLITAYKETIRNQGYGRVIKAASNAGYTVEVLDLQIQNSGLVDAVTEGIKTINQDRTGSKAILGFSTGALIAYKISAKIEFEKAFFCSLSPILNGDIPATTAPYVRYFGKEIVTELKKQNYGTSLAKRSFFFTGDKEGRKLVGRTKLLVRENSGELILVKNNNHELNVGYTNEIALKL